MQTRPVMLPVTADLGTCSPGFTVRSTFGPEQILSAPFSDVVNETRSDFAHLWSPVWLGIASAVGRHLRDSLSARLIVANARIHEVDTGLLLIAKVV